MTITPINPDVEVTDQQPAQRIAQVLRFNGITSLDLDADIVLDGAAKADLKAVVIMGYDANGEEFFASSMADGGDVLWLMERLKKRLLFGDDER